MSQRQDETSRGDATIAHRLGNRPGGIIAGRYKLLEPIGEGGMGMVWVAEQSVPVKRRVALKLIKPGMDSRQVVSRFEAERQALALMDHPNIAKVYDGGVTEEGRPFFVMEYVRGISITEYCDRAKLSIADRLRLLVPVCHAIQHAHQKGIIHRDLKPSNVLVCLYDGEAVPKVIDFGLAKAMSQPLTEHTLYTAHGMMVGTPAYMSPEQAEFNNLDIDTRTDIYSLGVILYELITGSTPLERQRFKDAAWQEVLRLIRDVEPPKPSTRLSTSADAATVASERGTEPAQLSRMIKGDLDWIVMKALEKERSRRYETPNSLALDIERFLRQETVLACPPSAAYRLKKLIQRNRAAVLSAAAIALCLLLGTIVSSVLAIHATSQRNLAQQRFIEAQEARATAEKDRDLAKRASAAEQAERQRAEEQRLLAVGQKRVAEEQRQLADEQRQAVEMARQAEASQRQAAERERDRAQALNQALEQQKEQQRRSLYTAEINLIQKAWDAENIVRVRELLHATRPKPGEADLRGFEWNYWQRLTHGDLSTRKLSGAASSSTVIFSQDGQQFAAIEAKYRNGETHHQLRVWETSTGKELLVKEMPFDEGTVGRYVGSAYIPPKVNREYRLSHLDALRVAVIRTDRPNWNGQSNYTEYSRNARQAVQLCVYRLLEGEQAFALETTSSLNSSRAAESFVFSRDGTNILSLSSRDQARLWDGRSGVLQREVTLPIAAVDSSAIGFRADGRALAFIAAPIALSGNALPSVRVPYFGEVKLPWRAAGSGLANRSIQIVDLESGAATAIAVGQQTGLAAAVNVLTGTAQTISVPQPAAFSQLHFSADGRRLVGLISIAGQSSARIWSTVSGDEVCRIADPMMASSFSRAAFSPDGEWLATTSRQGLQDGKSIRLWDAATGRPGPELKGHASAVSSLAFSSDGKTLVSSDRLGVVKAWEISAPRTQRVGPYQLQARSPDGTWLAAQTFGPFTDASVTLINSRDEQRNQSLAVPGTLSFCVFSPDSRLLLTASFDRKAASERASCVTFWDVATGKKVWAQELPAYSPASPTIASGGVFSGSAEGTAFSPDGRMLAMILRQSRDASKKLVYVWDVTDGRTLGSELFAVNTPALRFSPNSQLLVVGEVDTIHPSARNYVYTNADNSYSFSGSFGGVSVWRLPAGGIVVQQGPTISRICFSPDGKRIAALKHAAPNNPQPPQIILWDDQTGKEVATFPLEVGRIYVGLALSADHNRLALISGSGEGGPREVLILNAASGETVASLQGHNGAIVSAAFSPDGQRIATSAGLAPRLSSSSFSTNYSVQNSLIGETKIWDVESGHEVLTLAGGSEDLAFSTAKLGPELAAFATRVQVGPTWDASPLRPEVEAVELIESVLATEGAGRLLSRKELLARLTRDSSLREEVRQAALALAPLHRRSPASLNNAAWAIVQHAGGNAEDYARGLDYAEEACEAEPKNAVYLNTLGVAQYRLGRCEAAVARLERCKELRNEAKQAQIAEDSIFLAMAHHQLGHTKEAEKHFRQADRGTFHSASNRKFLDEAAALVGLTPASKLVFQGITARQKKDYEAALAAFDKALEIDPESDAAFRNRGYLWNERKEYDKAIADYNEAIRLVPENAIAHADRAVARENLGQLDQAEAGFNEALRLAPAFAFALGRRASLLRRKGELDAALKDLEEAIRIEPSNTSRYTTRAQIWQQKGDLDKAIGSYDAAVRAMPRYVTGFANRADLWRQKGDLNKALSDYDEALKINPRDAGYLNGRGNIWRQKQEYDKAIADYSEAIRLQPASSVYYNNRALAWSSKGELDKALADYNDALRIDPKNATALANRANLRKDRGELAEALADYDEALAINPKNATHLNLRGNTWWLKRDYDRAIADYSAALNANPNADGILANRGRAWLRKGDHDQAKQDLEEAIRLNPKRAYTFAYRAELQRSLNDKDAAMSDYDHAISLDPNAAISFGGRGSLRLENGDVDGALADLNEAIRLSPRTATYYDYRGRAWRQKSEYDNAIRDYDEALRLQPANAGYYNNRGFARFSKGDLDQALSDYNEALRINPKFVTSLGNRGNLWRKRGEYAAALADYDEATRVDAKYAGAYNGRATLWATCATAEFRNGALAVDEATKACELSNWKNADYLATLAAAYAEAGDFEKAQEWQQKALELGTAAVQERLQPRTELYRAGRPYREP